jgi:hypothetical protein
MLSVTERAVYGASMSSVPQLSLISKIVGLLTRKRPEGRAPTSRQLVDSLVTDRTVFRLNKDGSGFAVLRTQPSFKAQEFAVVARS